MHDSDVWGDAPLTDNEWNNLNSQFTNAGYREGITAGKEAALQEGFDSGFADVGAPIGRQLGLVRGMATALISFLSSPSTTSTNPNASSLLDEARRISSRLKDIRFSDIAPRDLEAEKHAQEHLDDPIGPNEELTLKRDMEALEDELIKLTSDSSSISTSARPSMEDVHTLQAQLDQLLDQLGIKIR